MNKAERELLILTCAFVLAPLIACLTAWPFFGSSSAIVPIAVGTAAGMAVYISSYLLHIRANNGGEVEAKSRTKEKTR